MTFMTVPVQTLTGYRIIENRPQLDMLRVAQEPALPSGPEGRGELGLYVLVGGVQGDGTVEVGDRFSV